MKGGKKERKTLRDEEAKPIRDEQPHAIASLHAQAERVRTSRKFFRLWDSASRIRDSDSELGFVVSESGWGLGQS
eukprot:3900443-Rhodomonas_salina.1